MSENDLKEYFVIISIFLLKDYTKHSSSSVNTFYFTSSFFQIDKAEE